MQSFPTSPILENVEHSARRYETLSLATLHTKVLALTEQRIKIKQNNAVLMVDAVGIVLEETILHPQGGGQPADQGDINQIPIVSVKEDKQTLSKNGNPTIYHFVEQSSLSENNRIFSPGQEVVITLNLDTRLMHARFHSAGHLIDDIIEQDPVFSDLSAKAISGHHFPNEAYIKVLTAHNINDRDELINRLNKSLAKQIAHNLPTASSYDQGVRHIKIGNSSRKCGGTHVVFTAEIDSCVVRKIKISELPPQSNDPFELTLFYAC